MKTLQKGFGLPAILIIVLLVGIGGMVGWKYFHPRHKSTTTATVGSSTSQPAFTAKPVAGTLALDVKKIPEGWMTDVNNSSQVVLSNSATKCSVEVFKTNDPKIKAPAAADVTKQQNDQAIASIKSKGYTVSALPNSVLHLSTNKEQQQLTTLDISLSGPQVMTTSYAYIVRDGYYITIHRSCPTQVALTSTDPALGIIAIND